MQAQSGSGTADSFAAEVNALKRELERLVALIEKAGSGSDGEQTSAIDTKARDFLARARVFIDRLGADLQNTASEQARAGAAHARAAVGEGTQRVEEAIRHRPLTAVAVAFGVGYVLSLLMRRR